MQVFKVYFKVILKNLPSMSIYLFIFILFSIILSSVGSNDTISEFTQTKSRIAFISNDGNEEFVAGFREFLSQNAIIVDIPDNTEKLQDALFFRKVEYIVRVPDGFTQSFLSGKDVKIDKTDVPGSASSISVDYIINRYLNTAKLYVKNINGITAGQIVKYVSKDLSLKADFQMKAYDGVESKDNNLKYYFNYFAYSIFSIMILAVTSFMMTFNDKDLRRRNLCSPIKPGSMNLQMILGNMTFAFVAWLATISFGLLIYREEMFNLNVMYMCINSLIFTFVCLSISFLIGNFIKSRGAQSAISNVLSLGLCFISGVFVPQQLLGKTVLSIASFTPTYWYVKANNEIASLSILNSNNLLPIIYSMLIQFGFATVIIFATIIIIRQKRTTNE